MLRTIGRWLLIAVLVVAVYRACGGDLTKALTLTWNAVSSVVTTGADWLLTLAPVRHLLGG